MRDILFKAKRIDNGEWVEGWIVPTMSNTYHDGYRIIDVSGINYDELDFYEPSFISWKVYKNTICQYTGLTDKNGNKIWENDVVWVGVTDMAIVIFSEKYSGYILQPIGDFYFDSPMLVDNVDIIDNIIGNIFDNAELLEG